jgi:hypothetical protein
MRLRISSSYDWSFKQLHSKRWRQILLNERFLWNEFWEFIDLNIRKDIGSIASRLE